MPDLREQWRRTAMRTIQECALDLFDARGFGAVTIEQIAVAAGVSPSSVYRYFGTKEGLLVADEFDLMSPEALGDVFDPADPVASLVQAVRRYESPPDPPEGARERTPNSWRRVRYFFSEPSVRSAALAALDRAATRVAPMLTTRDGLTPSQARVAAHAIAFGYFAALETWFDEGGARPIAEYVDEGLRPLSAVWTA